MHHRPVPLHLDESISKRKQGPNHELGTIVQRRQVEPLVAVERRLVYRDLVDCEQGTVPHLRKRSRVHPHSVNHLKNT